MHGYLVEHLSQEELALQHGVTKQLVSRLVCQARQEPEKQRRRKQREKLAEEEANLIAAAADDMLHAGAAITSCDQVRRQVAQEHQVKPSTADVNMVFKQSLGLSFRRVRKVPVQANLDRCLVLRQQYALAMLALLGSGKRVINVDETWLAESNYIRKAWCRRGTPGTVATSAVQPRLSMVTALDTDGRVYFALSHANTDQDTYMLFLRHLVAQLDRETPGWQEDSIILADNAPFHVGAQAREYLHKMQVPAMFSGPYSYSAAPIETLFSLLKLGELNKAHGSTGKK